MSGLEMDWDVILGSSGSNMTLNLWNVTDGSTAHSVPNSHMSSSWDMVTIGEGCLATSSNDPVIKVWDFTRDGSQAVQTLNGHTGNINDVDYCDGRLFSGSHDRSVRVWSLDTGENVDTYNGHNDAIYAVFVVASRMWLATGSDDHDLRLWDIEKGGGELVGSLANDHTSTILQCEYEPQNDWLLTACDDSTMKMFSLDTLAVAHTCQLTSMCKSVCPVLGTDYILTGTMNGEVVTWDIRKLDASVRTFNLHAGNCVRRVKLVDDHHAASCGQDGTVKYFKMDDGSVIHTFNHGQAVYGLSTLVPRVSGDPSIAAVRTPDHFERTAGLARADASLSSLFDFEVRVKDRCLKCWKVLLSDSQLDLATSNFVELDEALPISQDVFIQLLLGETGSPDDPDPSVAKELLLDAFVLFEGLKMSERKYVVCRAVAKVKDVPFLIEMFLQARDRLGEKEEPEVEGEEEEGEIGDADADAAGPEVSFRSPFCLAVFNRIKQSFGVIQKNRRMFRKLERAGLLGTLNFFVPKKIEDHPDFAETHAKPPRSFLGATLRVVKSLHPPEKFCDVTMKSSDGVSFKAHKAVLMWRSSFFWRLVSQGGDAAKAFMSQDEYSLDIRSEFLRVLLEQIYTRQCSCSNLRTLLLLLGFERLMQDKEFADVVRKQFNAVVKQLFLDSVFERTLIEMGDLLDDPTTRDVLSEVAAKVGPLSRKDVDRILQKTVDQRLLDKKFDDQKAAILRVEEENARQKKEIVQLRGRVQDLLAVEKEVEKLKELLKRLEESKQ